MDYFNNCNYSKHELMLVNYIDFSQNNNKLTTITLIVYSDMFRLT